MFSPKKIFIGIIVFAVLGFIIFVIFNPHTKKNVEISSKNNSIRVTQQHQLEATVSALMVTSQQDLAISEKLSQKKNLTEQDNQELYLRIQDAIVTARKASDAQPYLSATWINLSNVYQQINTIISVQNANKFAIAALQEAIKAEPQNYLPYYQLGMLDLKLKNYANAKALFQKAISLVPNSDSPVRLEIQQQLQKLQ